MFVGIGKPRKPRERAEARRIRAEEGLSYKKIAKLLGVSPHSVWNWTHDIEITEEQRRRNLQHMSPGTEVVKKRARTWSERNRRRRERFQQQGRLVARLNDPAHRAGCMLYWAEGSKSRNDLTFSNSDANMVRCFKRFLDNAFALEPEDYSLRLNVYLGNGLSLEEIEDQWLEVLELPRSCLRKHMINHFPTSSSGKRTNKLPHGVCTLRVLRSTEFVQHIYGAIQEYGGFDEPRWLDCDRPKPVPTTNPLEEPFFSLCGQEFERLFGRDSESA